jgi:hypothetical protein
MDMWYQRSHAKVTLASRYTFLANLWYFRAWKNFGIPDLVSSLIFISRALLDVSGDAIQGGRKDLTR